MGKKRYAWFAFSALCLALACLAGIWFTLADRREHFLGTHFEIEAQRITGKIGDRMTAYTEILRGAAGLFAASDHVTREEWRIYVDKLDLDQGYKGIQGVGFALYIPAAKLNAHIAAMRREGFADYVVKPGGKREDYSAIVYLEPFSGRNLRAFGYDMLSETVRRTALDIARDTGTIAISGKVKLLQETKIDVQAGILAYHPVYANGSVLQTVEQRRAALIGWTYSPYRMNDLMETVLRGELNNLQLEIFDGETVDPEARLFDSAAKSVKTTEETVSNPRSLTAKLELEGRIWTLRYTELPGFAAEAAYASSWRESVGLTVIGLLLTVISWALVNTRRQAESIAEQLTASLRESEERYRGLATIVPVGIFRTDRDGQCVYVNQRWLDMAGLPVGAALGEGWSQALHPDDRARVIDEWYSATRHKQNFQSEYRFLNPGGIVTWVLGTASAEIGKDGEVIGYIGSVTDITKRKQAEDALRQLNETLEQRVHAELSANRKKDHLIIQQSRFAAMGEMIGNIAHQWRQPLNTLGLTLANIEDAYHYHELTQEYLAKEVEGGKQLIQKMSSTIDDFRNFFRPHKEAEPFSATQAIQESISLVSASFRNNNIAIAWEAGEDACIQGFSNEFSQVLLNLFANAKDAILHHRIADGKVLVRLARDGQWVDIRVADNGGGIPAAVMDKIFEPYFSTKERGTGIGLYMSKMIIENSMRGQINVCNQGNGAEFTVRCRLAGQPAGDADHALS